jgi:sugar phosphate isomerase/epimerase
MKRSILRSLAAVAAFMPIAACATSAPAGSSSPGPAATTASAQAASAAPQGNVRTIGSVGAPIGLQLWSLRAMARTDPKAMLAFTRAQGITHVETAGLYGTPEQTAELLKAAGIRATSMHVSMDDFKKDPQKVIANAKALGVRYVGTAWYPHQAPFKESDARQAIADFNAIGKTMKAAGLQFFYHNHGYEPHPYGDGTLLDLMIRETDPDLVKFEMDVLWTWLPNVDPVALMKKYPGRFKLMHIKDMKPGVPRGSLSGGIPDSLKSVIGQGQVNWPEVLKAAKADGLEHYYLEDETTDPPKNIPPSVSFLEKIRF